MKRLRNILIRITMKNNDSYSKFIYAVADFVLLSISFFIVNYVKRGTFKLSPDYFRLLFLFHFIWFFVFLLTKKFRIFAYQHYLKGLLLHIKSILFITYFISSYIVISGQTAYSRTHIFGTCLVFFVLGILLFSLFYLGSARANQENSADRGEFKKLNISIFLLVSDFLLISFAFYFMNLFKRGNFILSPEYEKILLIFYGLWLMTSIITKKFSIQNFKNYYYALSACVKASILMGFTISVVIFAFRLFYFSRLQIFGTLLLLFILEAVLYYVYYILKNEKEEIGDIESIESIKDFFGQKVLSVKNSTNSDEASISFMKLIRDKYLKSYPQVFDFIYETIDLSNLKDSEIAIMRSLDTFNLKMFDKNSIKLLLNLCRINDVRWINRYFLDLHENLMNGAYFVGIAYTISSHKKDFFKKFPRYIAEVLYFFHFVFFRIFPKLPKLRKIYFAITKGKNRMISRAEVLGRLYFCGFKVLAEEEINGCLYFIAQKLKTPSLDKNPSYGTLIKLKRSGLDGQPVEIYKFRTMNPYSEYLQEHIYQMQKLDKGGKIKEDFRVTDWGKIMRRYWLDELPMLYNWIRGDIQLLGVRPLSKHYISLYDSYLQKIRKKVKPGLIPPYYADLPKDIEEISESEKRYIQAYCEHPLKTQFTYFWKIMHNIIFKGARSG